MIRGKEDRLEDDFCPVFVFDFDGVIVYTHESPLDTLIQSSETELTPRPIGLKALKEALVTGFVYIVSGRPKRDLHTIKQVLRRIGVNPGLLRGLLLRPSSISSETDWKLLALREILEKEGCIGEYHDDNPYALSAARNLVKHGLIIHLRDKCEPYTGYSILDSCRSGNFL